jgi:ABC-type sulfate transport system permease subunit
MRSKANTIAMTATWITVRTFVLFGLAVALIVARHVVKG